MTQGTQKLETKFKNPWSKAQGLHHIAYKDSVTHSSFVSKPSAHSPEDDLALVERAAAYSHKANEAGVRTSVAHSTSTRAQRAQHQPHSKHEDDTADADSSVVQSSFIGTASAHSHEKNKASLLEDGSDIEYSMWRVLNVERLKKYSFADFLEQFSRSYKPEHPEFARRKRIFEKNLQFLIQHNEGPMQTYMVGINKFMDYTEKEFQRMLGYKRTKTKTMSLLQREVPQWNDTISAVTLPTNHDWRRKLAQSQTWFQNQGGCGSCWAAAAVGCLQAHLEIKHGVSDLLSTQALVSCTPNPRHCGGTGGCQGATAELAFEYIAQNGIPADAKWPYMSGEGSNGECTASLAKQRHAMIDHHVVLPENKGQPLLQAIYQEGPVVVSVDASNWMMYSGGIFSGCRKDAIINHAVVAEGFGQQSGTKFYLIKNSWGADWGDKGYIRLMRFDDDEAHCGVDNKPEEGTACEGGPSSVRVCGMCGVLYDSTYPRGAKFVSKDEGGTFDMAALTTGLHAQEAKRNFMDQSQQLELMGASLTEDILSQDASYDAAEHALKKQDKQKKKTNEAVWNWHAKHPFSKVIPGGGPEVRTDWAQWTPNWNNALR